MYKFPHISYLDDVLPAIEGRDEFVVADKGDYIVVNYNVGYEDTFDIDPAQPLTGQLRRECRGLIFYPDGTLMSRPFHKFFNIGEREETLTRNIDMTRDHFVMEKLDGSMIRPLLLGENRDNLRLGTKMGITDTSEAAEKIITGDQIATLRLNAMAGITMLTEYTSPENRIVIEYDEPELVLLAARFNYTGEYLPYESLLEQTAFRVVPQYGSVDGSLDEYVAREREKEGREGFIISFGGEMHKGKNDWYVRIHKVKDKIRTDRHILALLLENELDDVYPHLDENDYNRVKKYERDFHDAYQQTLAFIDNAATMAINGAGGDRKRLATNVLPNSGLRKDYWRFVFGVDDGKDLNDMIMNHVQSKLGNTAKYNELAEWLGLSEDKGESE